MSVNRVNSDGSLSRIAGRGMVEYGASTTRSGTITISAGDVQNGIARKDITFDSPMPDADYEITFTIRSMKYSTNGTPSMGGNIGQKTKDGFVFFWISNSETNDADIVVDYYAFKLYTIEGLEELRETVGRMQSVLAAVSDKLQTKTWTDPTKDYMTDNPGITITSTNPNNLPYHTLPDDISKYGTLIAFGGSNYKTELYISVTGHMLFWSSNHGKWEQVTSVERN
ncbi:MAG: hypothetical protein IJ716_14255 [Lachnospiraceae bacterium]|nr:hypothetical protein [Lachnospiraceae bacterium]